MPKMKKLTTAMSVYFRTTACSCEINCLQKDSSDMRYLGFARPMTQVEGSRMRIIGISAGEETCSAKDGACP